MEQYLTLREAAEQLGVTPSALRHAIGAGHLRSVLRGGAHWTTQAWLDAYAAHVAANRGGKGKKRGPRRSADESPGTD